MSTRVAAELVVALSDPDREARQEAEATLEAIFPGWQDDAAILEPALLRLLQRHADDVLDRCGPGLVPLVREAATTLGAGEFDVALAFLVRRGTSAAADILAGLADGGAPRRRWLAAQALAKLDDARARVAMSQIALDALVTEERYWEWVELNDLLQALAHGQCVDAVGPLLGIYAETASGFARPYERTPGLILKTLDAIDVSWATRPEAQAAVPQIARCLASTSDEWREYEEAARVSRIADVLGRIGSRSAVGPLAMAFANAVGWLFDGRKGVDAQRATADALRRIDPEWTSLPEAREAAPALAEALTLPEKYSREGLRWDDDRTIRRDRVEAKLRCAAVLAKIEGERALPALQVFAELLAARFPFESQSEQLTRLLIEAFHSSGPAWLSSPPTRDQRRRLLVDALSWCEDDEIDRFLTVLGASTEVLGEILSESDRWGRRAALAALRGLRARPEPAAVSALEDRLLHDGDQDVRARAGETLGAVGNADAVTALLKALQDADQGKLHGALLGLRELGWPAKRELFMPLLGAAHGPVRALAVEALSHHGDLTGVEERVIELCLDSHDRARNEAEKALGNLSPSKLPRSAQVRLLDLAASALNGEDASLRRPAARLVRWLGQPSQRPPHG